MHYQHGGHDDDMGIMFKKSSSRKKKKRISLKGKNISSSSANKGVSYCKKYIKNILLVILMLLTAVYLGITSARYEFDDGYIQQEKSISNHIRQLRSRNRKNHNNVNKKIRKKKIIIKTKKIVPTSASSNVISLNNKQKLHQIVKKSEKQNSKSVIPQTIVQPKINADSFKKRVSTLKKGLALRKSPILQQYYKKKQQIQQGSNSISKTTDNDDTDEDDEAEDVEDEKIGCYLPYEFKLEENVDLKGGENKNAKPILNMESHQQCCENCVKKLGCVGFTFIPSIRSKTAGKCYLKSFDGKKNHVAPSLRIISGELSKKLVRKKDNALKQANRLRTKKILNHEYIHGTPPSTTVEMYGSKITIGVGRQRNIELLQRAIINEQYVYKIMKSAISLNQKKSLMVDIGAAYANFALFALSFGATQAVIFEPQDKLCRLINWSARENKFIDDKNNKMLKVYELAVLNTKTKVHMSKSHVLRENENKDNDGVNTFNPDDVFNSDKRKIYPTKQKYKQQDEMAEDEKTSQIIDETDLSIISNTHYVGDDISSSLVSTYPLTDFIKTKEIISFLRIDVDGSEISILQSAFPIFDDDRVDNVFLHFGPPSKWMVSTDSEANEGLDVLMKMDRFDFEIRMLSTSPVYYQFRETITARNSKFIPLKNKITWKKLINIMSTANAGCHLWFSRNPTDMDIKMNKPVKNDKSESSSWLRI